MSKRRPRVRSPRIHPCPRRGTPAARHCTRRDGSTRCCAGRRRPGCRLKTLVIHEHLASDPTHAVDTTFWKRAPDRLHFRVRGGDDTIIIGARRWDRAPHGSWTRSASSKLGAIEPSWTPLVESASLLGTARMAGRPAWVVSFANPAIPAWFTVWIDKRTYRTLEVSMTATGHFMTNRYTGFDSPLAIEPPKTR